MVKVSVVMPNYNGEKYIGEAIKSVLNQSFNDLELIIVDDASTDNSRKIIDSFEDERIIKLYQHKIVMLLTQLMLVFQSTKSIYSQN